MRFLFTSTRGTGHVQPLIPYARGLVARGHEVLFAAPADVGAALREKGFEHAPFGHPGDEALGPIWARLRGVSGEEANRIAISEIFAGANASAALPGLQATIRSYRPDAIVRESAELGALVAAEAAGVPHACVQVHGGKTEEMLFSYAVAPIDALRARAGLAADGGASLRNEAVLCAFPASLDGCDTPRQLRAPLRVRMPDEAPSTASPAGLHWAPPDDGTPLIYITFGTILGGMADVRAIYRTALDAVAELRVRALLTTGPGIELSALGVIPANVRVEAWVPQRDVLPHVVGVVCHGGSGTLLGALAAGVPMIVIPFGADQPANAQSVAAAHAGIALPKPDAAALRAAIETLLGSAELREGAAKIALEMAAMPTIESALDALIALPARA